MYIVELSYITKWSTYHNIVHSKIIYIIEWSNQFSNSLLWMMMSNVDPFFVTTYKTRDWAK